MNPPQILWVLTDGKPGHENQSLGLAEAIARRTDATIHRLHLDPALGWIARLRATSAAAATLPPADAIIAAGHRTHLTLLCLARKYRARSIVLMRPTLPLACFDLCIAPSHDFPRPLAHPKLLISRGALNRVVASTREARTDSLILLGGPSKIHGWDGPALFDAVRTIAATGTWTLTDSRRTPSGFLDDLRQAAPEIAIHPHQETSSGWLPARLALAREVWVTEDSISMIYEALSSGARVGVLPSPRLKDSARVLAGVAELIADGFLTPYQSWLSTRTLAAPPRLLAEADRCAVEVIVRLSLSGT